MGGSFKACSREKKEDGGEGEGDSKSPSTSPSLPPSLAPTSSPSRSPSTATIAPTLGPTASPSASPSHSPSSPTSAPSNFPTRRPTGPTPRPTRRPTQSPTRVGSASQRKSGRGEKESGELGKFIGIAFAGIVGICGVVCFVQRRIALQDARESREANDMMRDASRSPLLGMRVRIHGLKSRKEFNGRVGVAERWNNEKQCYIVVLDYTDEPDADDVFKRQQQVGMSADNLELESEKSSATDKVVSAFARRDSAEDFSRLNALLCTAVDRILISACCFAQIHDRRRALIHCARSCWCPSATTA